MKDYNVIYAFEAYDALAEGKSVMMLDRKECVVYDAAEMKAAALATAVKSKEKNRFEFWIEEESENDDE